MLPQFDPRKIMGSKMSMAYSLYMCDCLSEVTSTYLSSSSPKFIGYEYSILPELNSYESMLSITEEQLSGMVDNTNDLSEYDLDNIADACASFMRKTKVDFNSSNIVERRV